MPLIPTTATIAEPNSGMPDANDSAAANQRSSASVCVKFARNVASGRVRGGGTGAFAPTTRWSRSACSSLIPAGAEPSNRKRSLADAAAILTMPGRVGSVTAELTTIRLKTFTLGCAHAQPARPPRVNRLPTAHRPVHRSNNEQVERLPFDEREHRGARARAFVGTRILLSRGDRATCRNLGLCRLPYMRFRAEQQDRRLSSQHAFGGASERGAGECIAGVRCHHDKVYLPLFFECKERFRTQCLSAALAATSGARRRRLNCDRNCRSGGHAPCDRRQGRPGWPGLLQWKRSSPRFTARPSVEYRGEVDEAEKDKLVGGTHPPARSRSTGRSRSDDHVGWRRCSRAMERGCAMRSA